MREERMILSDLRTPFDNLSDETSSSPYDWHRDRATYSEQQIGEMPTWIKTKRIQVTDVSHPNHEVVDTNTFSEMQKHAYDIVNRHVQDTSEEKYPLCLYNYRCRWHWKKLFN